MRFLITAGPTREPLDPVRYLSNRSSGKMGYAIARAAIAAGHETLLISGPVSLPAPAGANVIQVITGAEMCEAVHEWVTRADVCVLCAAVTDFRPRIVAEQKIKKQGSGGLTIELEPVRDILLSLHERKVAEGLRKPVLVGFAAETESVLENARAKLRAKGCALLAVNDVSQAGIGFESDDNALTLLFASGETHELPRASKDALAAQLVKIIEQLPEILVDVK
jgi:phosphopantothenoylcysteine synthetase/decarboxylase